MQLAAVDKAGCVDDKVVMVLSVVEVSCYEDFVLGKKLFDELHTDTVSLLGCDVILWTERLDILIEPDVVLALAESHLLLGGIESLGCKERFLCKLGNTVMTTDQLDLLVELRLVRTHTVIDEPALGRGCLFGLGYVLNDSYDFSHSFAMISSSFS